MTQEQINQIIKLRDSGEKWVVIALIMNKHFSTCSNAYYKAKGEKFEETKDPQTA